MLCRRKRNLKFHKMDRDRCGLKKLINAFVFKKEDPKVLNKIYTEETADMMLPKEVKNMRKNLAKII